MNFTLVRTDFLPTGIFGKLISADNALILETLERGYEVNSTWLPKIPEGTYLCKRRHSPEFKYDLFWLTNVPNNGVDPTDNGKQFYDFIEIHKGNTSSDSRGCILLGCIRDGNVGILGSKTAFERLMTFQFGVEEFNLEVK